jgi:hypothetical protein
LPVKLSAMLLKKSLPLLLGLSGLIYITLFISGCWSDSEKPDTSKMSLIINADRFEKDLFSIDSKNPGGGISAIRKKYGNFFNLYTNQITSLGSPDSVLMAEKIVSFISDSNFYTIYTDCEKLYNDFSEKNAELTEAFRNYSFYFPDKHIPRIITLISGFSYPVICDSTTLGIGLDMYLGPEYKYYSTLEPPLPVYLRNRMHGSYMVTDAMKGWAASDYGIDESSARMLDFMVSQGRLLYFLDKVTPEASDTLKSGYTSSQLDWCRSNEKRIWSFFIDNKLLFSFDPNLMNKFVNDGPTTNGFPKESPGNLGQFIGWQIVKSYMANHKDISLEQLMNEKSMQKIFDESKYKPSR